MNEHSRESNLSRRKALAGIGAGGVVFAQFTSAAFAQEPSLQTDADASSTQLARCPTVQGMKDRADLADGQWVETAGFHVPGDGGGAFYRIQKLTPDLVSNDADVVELKNGLIALLRENEAVNYRMFGGISDGEQDDGVPIKLAHQYANARRIPVVNLSGEFWIKQTNAIPITTNVHWGQTIFHIDEQYNDRRNPRFIVRNDRPARTLKLDSETKAALLEKIKPGVQIIPELAPYAGHLISVADSEDRIGIRAGNYSKRGWAREELFYVEEEGRIIGDIAWAFKNFTSVTARPCNDNYLVIEGGGFYFSGTSAVGSSGAGYHHHGIEIERSRTIIREQWMGLERGKQDISMQPRRGFYVFNGVYDVILENIRAMPWEKNRKERDRVLSAGTYGIGGGRMLNCTFRNLTAEGGWVAWGVFGTNLNKNFRIENCRLNRIDVHFHCWNLYIRDCEIGFKGISVTGGGDLFVENTTRYGNHFLNFRRDYGAKWDGRVRLRGCTLKPTGTGTVRVLSHAMADFDYQYPIGFARSVKIEDLLIDFGAAPDSRSPCWLMDIVPFSKTEANARLFFPNRIEFRNIAVQGRSQGVRLMRVPNPHHYDLRREGRYDGNRLEANCVFVFDNVQLERLTPRSPDDTERVHLLIGGSGSNDYLDELALYPEIHFINCQNVSLRLSHCIASAFLNQCSVNTLWAPALRGELRFNNCRFEPDVQQASANLYAIESTLGAWFTNCAIHAPEINGQMEPGMVNRTGFLKLNESVRHYHLNTVLGNEIVSYYRNRGTELTPEFVAKLKSHHALEA